jgi:hypothetical protein
MMTDNCLLVLLLLLLLLLLEDNKMRGQSKILKKKDIGTTRKGSNGHHMSAGLSSKTEMMNS